MIIRNSSIKDVPIIMEVIADAQQYLASLNIDQWQDGYPSEAQILIDIFNDDSYVVIDENQNIIGATVFTTKIEHTYNKIEGKWLTEKDAAYGVIHRLAVSNKYRKSGFAKFVFQYCEEVLKEKGIGSMRVDTHKDNKGMQALIESLGYEFCGIIILESGAERLAYEKILS